MEAVVLGAGVSGLSTAIRLQEAGYTVHIWANAHPLVTTSSVAAALWYPYKAYPEERVLAWGKRTYDEFVELARNPSTGVLMREGIELWREPMPDPWWRDAVPAIRRPTLHEIPPGYRDGYIFEVPIIEMPIYLDYLLLRFESNGGALHARELDALDEAVATGALVINCTGLGSHSLINDPLIRPIRGQIVRVTNPGLERFVLDDEHPEGILYIVPRANDCILGGTAEDDRWDTQPDRAIAEAIVRRCTEIEPKLTQATILEHKVGLRPGRPAIRLEREIRANGAVVVHNYGHGGAGVTLSWGCAEEVVQLAQSG